MREQELTAAVGIQRQIFAALTEILELTQELADALSRQDEMAVDMFLNLRQEEINHLQDYQALLEKQCAVLGPEEGGALRAVLTQQRQLSDSDVGRVLCRLVQQNKGLLDRVIQIDRMVSARLGGAQSFYTQSPQTNR